jgi:hypothetical protein
MTKRDEHQFTGYASPNYTPVPDELFDEQLPDLSGAELKVLLYVIRRTFGFKRESDTISISQMLNGLHTYDGRQLDRGVGLTKKTLLLAIKSLEEKNIIFTERRRSVERGDEPTSYRLHVADGVLREKTTPPVGEKLPQGGGGIIPPGPWGKNYPTQDTEGKTERNTDLDHSNIRKSNHSNDDFVDNSLSQPISAEPQNGHATPGSSVKEWRGMEGVGEVIKRKRGRPRKYSDEVSQTILNYVTDFAREFADKATVNQSAARFINDYHKWGRGEMDAFVGILYQARSITKSQGGIRGSKFAYFCSVVEDLLGLKDDEEATPFAR